MRNNLTIGSAKLPQEEWKIAYLASMIDGEGTIGLFKNKNAFEKQRPHFLVTNNSTQLMSWLQGNFGGKIQKHDNAWRWGVWSVRDVSKLTQAILPYLVIKRDNAEKVNLYCTRNLESHLQ